MSSKRAAVSAEAAGRTSSVSGWTRFVRQSGLCPGREDPRRKSFLEGVGSRLWRSQARARALTQQGPAPPNATSAARPRIVTLLYGNGSYRFGHMRCDLHDSHRNRIDSAPRSPIAFIDVRASSWLMTIPPARRSLPSMPRATAASVTVGSVPPRS